MKNQTKKPKAKVTGSSSNVFITLGICIKALKNAGLNEQSKEMNDRVWEAKNYNEALKIMGEYCELS